MGRILFYGDDIPSFNLSARFLIKKHSELFSGIRVTFCYTRRHKIVSSFVVKKDISVLWIVRKCDLSTIALANQAKQRGIYVVYEFDDSFDSLPASDRVHTEDGFLAGFYWMLANADLVKSYEPIAEDLLDISKSGKLNVIYGVQYTPFFSTAQSVVHRAERKIFRVGVLASNIDSELSKRYNRVINDIKRRLGRRLILYSFNPSVNFDVYIEPISDIEEYYKKVNELELNASISITSCNYFNTGKTPNKFREAAGFGYVCVASASRVFESIPDDLMIKCKTDSEIVDAIVHLATNRREGLAISQSAQKYARERYSSLGAALDLKNTLNKLPLDIGAPLWPFYHNFSVPNLQLSVQKEVSGNLVLEDKLIQLFARTFKGLGLDVIVLKKNTLTDHLSSAGLRLYNEVPDRDDEMLWRLLVLRPEGQSGVHVLLQERATKFANRYIERYNTVGTTEKHLLRMCIDVTLFIIRANNSKFGMARWLMRGVINRVRRHF